MATTLTPAQRAERIKLRDDFEYWAKRCYKVIPKDGSDGLVPLVLNAAQRHIHAAIKRQIDAGLPVRLVILKGRQQGASTLIEAWQLHRTTQGRGKKAVVLAHEAEAASGLFEQAKRGYDNLPELLKPAKDRSNKRELSFGLLDSSLEVTTAGGRGIGRGKTYRYCHASEVGFWPPNTAEANWNGLHQCVPNSPDSAVFVESTANGMGGLFHRLWTTASRGMSEFEAVFVPWFWQDEYRTKAPDGFTRTPEESELVLAHGASGLNSDDQLYWRRGKIAATSRDLFNQEYPNTPDDAFLTSGRPVFDAPIIYDLLTRAVTAESRMTLETPGDSDDPEWVKHTRGELHVFDPPKPDRAYYIGADVAEGIQGGDFSVAQVLDDRRVQVATWRGHIYPDAFGEVLAKLGDLYNSATIAVELNNHGILTANKLAKDLGYPDVWTDHVYDQITDRETVRLGFTQNPKTRPMILNKLRAEVRDAGITLRDEVTLREMLHFVVTESGRMEAERGSHDDHVMALAIANHINEGEWLPIVNQESYFAKIE